MSPQDALFHEDVTDALRHAIKALGGFEVVGHDLWPTKPRAAAGRLLSDCLNPERPAKLDLDDVVALLRMARERGVHCAMWQLADDAGYTRPAIAPTKTPEQELADRMLRHAQEYARLADEHAAIKQANDRGGPR